MMYRLLPLLIVFLSVPVYPVTEVFWRYAKDRYDRLTLTESLDVPEGSNPYDFLAGYQGYEAWLTRKDGVLTFLAEKAVRGSVPILSIHKISQDDEFALTADRFRSLLKYIRANGWYLVSDYQYLNGDFTRVPTGKKPIVMGSDDASYGTLIYKTLGDQLSGKVRRILGEPLMDEDSMVAILERYALREEKRINFTFYISFDAVPFRQLDGFSNPGFPYSGIPVVGQKIRYLDKNFILGIHSLSHIYAYDMGVENFVRDVKSAWALIDEYAGGEAQTVRTMAFPYGIRDLSSGLRNAIKSLERNGRFLSGSFDLNGSLAPSPGALKDQFTVNRINVDNRNWQSVMTLLKNTDAVRVRRDVIMETTSKRLPQNLKAFNVKDSDAVWILVRKS